MGTISAILSAISAIGTIVKFLSALKDAIGQAQFDAWIADLEGTTKKWSEAKTSEAKSAVAKDMVSLIGRLPR